MVAGLLHRRLKRGGHQMSQGVKLWNIDGRDRLEEYLPAGGDLGGQLEEWIAEDVSILSPDLLIIGRRVETSFGGVIDLLCLDRNGDVVVVELTRDITPHEVIAQALDHASWVHGLSRDRVSAMAAHHLAATSSLGVAFAQRFGLDLPDALNQNHSILIVGSQVDASTERIITYLSDAYGVGISAVAFHSRRTVAGNRILVRTSPIRDEKVEPEMRPRPSADLPVALTYDQLQDSAEEKGVGDLTGLLVNELHQFFNQDSTGTCIAFTGDFDGSQRTVLTLLPPESSQEDGLRFRIYLQRFCRLFDMAEADVLELLPQRREAWIFYERTGSDYSGYTGYFQDAQEIKRFVDGLRAISQR